MPFVEVTLSGCDDQTEFVLDMTPAQYRYIQEISEVANAASTYGCQPRMYVKEVDAPKTDDV
jgi:hypothetical protein